MIWTYGQPVRVTLKTGVAGLAAADFTTKLTEDGAASTLAVSVTELTALGTGVYMFAFTPPDSSVKKHYCLRVVYGTPGGEAYVDNLWDVDIQPYVGGQVARLEVFGDTGKTILAQTIRDGNADAGVSWTITEDADFGANVYAAVATLPESEAPYFLAVRLYTADGSIDTTFNLNVQPSYNNLVNLEGLLREALGNPGYDELSYAQAQKCWTLAVREYSKHYPREDYDTSIRGVASQKDYTLPDEEAIIDVFYCYIASTLAGLTAQERYYRDYRDSMGKYTNTGARFELVNRKLRILPAPETSGEYIGTLLHKAHIFSNGACTTISPVVMETLIQQGAKAQALLMLAGYQGSVRVGTASEDMSSVQERGEKLWKDYRLELSAYNT